MQPGLSVAGRNRGVGGSAMEMLVPIGIVLVVVDVIAIVMALGSRLTLAAKLMWIALVLGLPFAGAVFFFVMADIHGLRTGNDDEN